MDSNQYQQYFAKTDQLPEEVQYFFDSQLFAGFLKTIADRYNVSADDIQDLVDSLVINDFSYDILLTEIKNQAKIESAMIDLAVRDVWGYFVLPLNKFLPKLSLVKIFEQRGGKPADYSVFVEALQVDLSGRWLDLADKLNEKYDELTNWDEESADALHLFSTKMLDILKADSGPATVNLNGSLINLLSNKKNFKEDFSQLLLSSTAQISNRSIMVDGKSSVPSIASWLRDFIVQNGAGIFNNLTLSGYVANSPNAQKLSPADKELLRRLLLLYRNVKFFPDNFKGVDPLQWEIVPVDESSLGPVKNNVPSAGPFSAVAPATTTKSRPTPVPVAPASGKFSGLPSPDEFKKMSPIERLALMEDLNLTISDINQYLSGK
ncbi:MAG: hypothetical protein WC516_00270 [Patescibacteria group bacterium]